MGLPVSGAVHYVLVPELVAAAGPPRDLLGPDHQAQEASGRDQDGRRWWLHGCGWLFFIR